MNLRELITTLGFEVNSTGLQQAEGRLDSLKSKVFGLAGSFGTLAAITYPAAKLEHHLARLGEVFQGTDEAFRATSKAMADQAAIMAGRMGISSTEIADTFVQTIDAGAALGTKAFDELSGTALKLSKVMRIDASQSVELLANITEQMTGNLENATKVADGLVLAGQLGRTSATQLASALSIVGDTAKVANLPFEDLTAVIAKLQTSGLTGAKAGSALKTMLVSLYDATGPAAKALSQYGIQVFDPFTGKAKPAIEVLEQVNDLLNKLPESQKIDLEKQIGGSRGADALNKLFRGGSKDIKNWSKQIANASGTLDKSYERAMEDMDEQTGRLRAGLGGLAAQLGTPLLAPITRVVKWIADLVGNIQEWIQANRDVVDPVMKVIGVITAIIGVMSAWSLTLGAAKLGLFLFKDLLLGLLGPFKMLAAVLTSSIFWWVMLGLAIMDVTAAVMGGKSLIGDLINYLDETASSLIAQGSAWGYLLEAIKLVLELFITLPRLVIDGMKQLWLLVSNFKDIFSAIYDMCVAYTEDIITTIVDKFSGIGKIIKSALKLDWKGVKEGAAAAIGDNKLEQSTKAYEKFQGIISNVADQSAAIANKEGGGIQTMNRLMTGKGITPEAIQKEKDQAKANGEIRTINEKQLVAELTVELQKAGNGLGENEAKVLADDYLKQIGKKEGPRMEKTQLESTVGLERDYADAILAKVNENTIVVASPDVKTGPTKVIVPEQKTPAINIAAAPQKEPGVASNTPAKPTQVSVTTAAQPAYFDKEELDRFKATMAEGGKTFKDDQEAMLAMKAYFSGKPMDQAAPEAPITNEPAPIRPILKAPPPQESPAVNITNTAPIAPKNEGVLSGLQKQGVLPTIKIPTPQANVDIAAGKAPNVIVDQAAQPGMSDQLKGYLGSKNLEPAQIHAMANSPEAMGTGSIAPTNNAMTMNQNNNYEVNVTVPPGTSKEDSKEILTDALRTHDEERRRQAHLEHLPVFVQ